MTADKIRDFDDLAKRWLSGAEDALDAADKLYNSGKYHFALFFLHLSLEKLLKAVFIKTRQKHCEHTHNLAKLAGNLGVKLTNEELKQLYEITRFNISARYDEIKEDFYKKATKEFASFWMDNGKKLFKYFKILFTNENKH